MQITIYIITWMFTVQSKIKLDKTNRLINHELFSISICKKDRCYDRMATEQNPKPKLPPLHQQRDSTCDNQELHFWTNHRHSHQHQLLSHLSQLLFLCHRPAMSPMFHYDIFHVPRKAGNQQFPGASSCFSCLIIKSHLQRIENFTNQKLICHEKYICHRISKFEFQTIFLELHMYILG